MRLTELLEALKAPPVPVDTASLLNRLKASAQVLSGYPYDLDWDFQYGNALKQRVTAMVAKHNEDSEEEDFRPIHEGDLWIGELQAIYGRLAMSTFYKVRQEVRHEENEYQSRHAARMDDEAGYHDPMHYIESSDWLSAMQLQERMGVQLDGAVSSIEQVERIIQVIEDFATEFLAKYKTESGDEPIVVEGMRDGLRGAVPLLMLALKKAA